MNDSHSFVGKFKSERDEELDRAVDRLEAEVTRGRKEVEQEFTERIRRLREKYEGELEVLGRKTLTKLHAYSWR